RPDGRLVYRDLVGDTLREFHCDGCPSWDPGQPYPSNPLDNDIALSAPPCDSTSGVGVFLYGISGERLHRCSGGTQWHRADGTPITTLTARSLGHDNKLLTDTAIVDISTGTQVSVTGL